MTEKIKNPSFIDIPQSAPIDAVIRIPGSKSLSNRAILIAALAEGLSQLEGVLSSDDTKYMTDAWRALGAKICVSGANTEVIGCGGKLSSTTDEIYVENAGTAARFLTATLTIGEGKYILTGNERMRQRPIDDLLVALKQLGAEVKDIAGTGCPPVEILASGLNGGEVAIPGNKSSQYISAIMLTAPYARRDTVIKIEGELVSRTYVEMTRAIMRYFEAKCEWRDSQTIIVHANHPYRAKSYRIEGDASSASYFFGMAAVTGGRVKVQGIDRDSTQGDLGLLNALAEMGCHVIWESDGVILEGKPMKGITVDMNTMSDVAPTLAVVALFAHGTTKILNVGNMRIKECDRIQAVTTELRKLGARVEEWDDGLSITGMGNYTGACLDTYDDHRMAMSLSLAGLKIPDIRIVNPGCVSKTFPDFYEFFLPLIK